MKNAVSTADNLSYELGQLVLFTYHGKLRVGHVHKKTSKCLTLEHEDDNKQIFYRSYKYEKINV